MKQMKQILLCLIGISSLGWAQNSKADLWTAAQAHQTAQQKSPFKNLSFENIGPAVMSGRVVALAVNPEDPTEFYVAYATGGLWHTTDNGISFKSIADQAWTQHLGALTVDWNTRTLWVGTGENNSSRSSYAGVGILKSTDNGETWEHKGLSDSHHIGRILVDPKNPNYLVVGVTGHLYSPNASRGIYISADGGDQWEQKLFVNDQSGIIDLVAAPDDFNTLYASAWEKDRKAWNFDGDGAASGIFKSSDAGQSWARISTPESGFSQGDGVGRIGLAAYDAQTLYAIHDNQFRRKKEKKEDSEQLSKDDFREMSRDAFLALDDSRINTYLKNYGFHEKYRAANVKNMVREGKVKPLDLALYLEDANALLFDTPVIGTEVYKSTDGGLNWKKTHKDYLDGVYYSYGYYFGRIHVAPHNPDKIYIYGVPLLTSEDGGQNFRLISKPNVHADHHDLWINPNRPGHLINGNDGGVNITYDDGEHWMKNNSPEVGQFYAIAVDQQKPYRVYGGLQDNGVWMAKHTSRESPRWYSSGQNPWKSIMGGDGMQIQIDPRNPNIVFTGYQFGNYSRLDLNEQQSKAIQPKHELGEAPYRFNWQTPIWLSRHQPDVLYFGSNKFHRSLNQGESWETLSDDLTQGGRKGNVAYGTLTSIHESPIQFGLLYTGSDDGLVYRKQPDSGWENISSSFPKDLWVSRVIASAHELGRVYVTLNGYRWDDMTAYVYRSDDFGATWTSVTNGLPSSPVNVIREDPNHPELLYLGNDLGVYISTNGGAQWYPFAEGLTTVAVHDLAIQQEAQDLLVGTHGRSIYLADIAPLHELAASDSKKLMLLKSPKLKHSKRWGSRRVSWAEPFTPEPQWVVWSPNASTFTAIVTNTKGKKLQEWTGNFDTGINHLTYDWSTKVYGKKESPADNGKHYLSPGAYQLKIVTSEAQIVESFELK